MLRVTSGIAKGKKLNIPSIPGFRAVQDKVKLAVFSILDEKVNGADCLDLFAGSGSLGIEALSRGAKHCDFVEKTRTGMFTIEENLRNTGFEEKAEIFRKDAINFVGNTVDKYDIIFADPFFDETHHRFLFENMEEILNKNGVIVFSHGKDMAIEDAMKNTKKLELFTQRRYGAAYISVVVKK